MVVVWLQTCRVDMRKAAAGELLFPPPIDLLLETRKFSIFKLMHVIDNLFSYEMVFSSQRSVRSK